MSNKTFKIVFTVCLVIWLVLQIGIVVFLYAAIKETKEIKTEINPVELVIV